MSVLKQLVSLALLFVSVHAAAPAITPLQFQITQTGNPLVGCIAANGITDNSAVVIQDCSSALKEPHTFSLEKAGATSGTGAPGAIHVFGDKCLDVTNGVNADGTRLQIFDCTPGNTNQMFNVNGDGTITWAGTNKCIDLTNGVLQPGTPLQIFTCFPGNTNQRFNPVTVPAVANTARLNAPKSPSFTPCISASRNADNAPAVVEDCTNVPAGGNATLALSPSGFGTIVTNNNKCLDVTNGVNADGTLLQWFTCATGNTNQRWSINTLATTGNRQIQWVGTNKCVDLPGDNEVAGQQLQIFTCINGNTNQQWFVKPF